MRDLVAALDIADLDLSLFIHFVNAHDGVHGDKGALHIGKLTLEFLFCWLNDKLGSFTKDKLFNLNKTHQIALKDLSGINFVYLTLIVENDFKNRLLCH